MIDTGNTTILDDSVLSQNIILLYYEYNDCHKKTLLDTENYIWSYVGYRCHFQMDTDIPT